MTAPSENPPTPSAPASRSDVAVAIGNTAKLGGSLLITWSVALAVRFQLPRYLGPVTFGQFNFCDAFTVSFFSLLSFGVGTYIQREIPVRPQHATDFFGGVCLIRAVFSVLLLAIMAVTLEVTGRPSHLQLVVLVFGLTYFTGELNSSLGLMLQATTKVNALAVVNIASKLVWGGGLALAVLFDARLAVFAVPYLCAELLRTVILVRAVRETIGLRFEVHFGATKQVLVASLPFAANAIAVTLGAKLDVSLLEFLSSSVEVGWYGAADNFASLAMLLSPVVSWVLMPLMARAKHRSDEEFFQILRRAIEAIMVLSIPSTLFIGLGADLWMRVAFGSEFENGAPALMMLAPTFVFTYLTILYANALILLGRSWTLTFVSILKLAVLPAAIVVVVPFAKDLGPGHAGTGTALAVVITELLLSVVLGKNVGARALDRRSIRVVLRSTGVAGAIFALHLLVPQAGHWRLAYEVPLYVLGALIVRAVDLSDVRDVIRLMRRRRKGAAPIEASEGSKGSEG